MINVKNVQDNLLIALNAITKIKIILKIALVIQITILIINKKNVKVTLILYKI